MKNEFRHNNNGTTTIFIKRKNKPNLETIISTLDFEKVNEFPNTWYANLHIGGSYRVMGELPQTETKRRVVYLHRWIMGSPEGKEIDHRNMDQLDNRRENLRIVTREENMQNRKGNKNSSIKYRNVLWDKARNKYRVELTVNKVKIYVGRFDDIEEANKAAIKARQKYFTHNEEE